MLGLFIGASSGIEYRMEKLPEYHEEEDTEDWLEVFECRAACSNARDERTKLQWCRSVIGSVGRRILKSLDDRAGWDEAKEELRKYLGEENPREAAWKMLRRYKGKGKCIWEIVSEVKELAVKAAKEEDVQERLAVEAFLGAIPWPLAKSIRSKRIENLQGALEEARLMQMLDEEEEGKKRVQAMAEEPRADRREERRPAHREERCNPRRPVCWGCGEEGHLLLNCELWQSFKQERHRRCPGHPEERRAKMPELN